MPQVCLEYSKEISCSKKQVADLFEFVAKKMIDVLQVAADGIKFRAHKLEDSRVGYGDNYQGFIHLSIAVLKKSERTQDMFDNLGKTYLAYLEENFAIDKKCISVEFREMDASKYYKY